MKCYNIFKKSYSDKKEKIENFLLHSFAEDARCKKINKIKIKFLA